MIPSRNGKLLVWDTTSPDTRLPPCMSQELPVKQEQWLLWQRTGRRPNIHAWNQLTPSLQLPLRTSGVFGPLTPQFLKDLGNRLRQVTGDETSYTYRIQRLCVSAERKRSIGAGNNWTLTPFFNIFCLFVCLFVCIILLWYDCLFLRVFVCMSLYLFISKHLYLFITGLRQ